MIPGLTQIRSLSFGWGCPPAKKCEPAFGLKLISSLSYVTPLVTIVVLCSLLPDLQCHYVWSILHKLCHFRLCCHLVLPPPAYLLSPLRVLFPPALLLN